MQHGFRTGQSCIDAVLTVKQIAEKALELNKPAYICFVNPKKAFDNFDLCDILNILLENNLPN